MEPNEAAELPLRAAGKLMTNRVPMIRPEATIGEIEALLLRETKTLETVNYIYVVDGDKRLRGVVSVKEVFRTAKHTPVAEIMTTELVTARPHTSPERIALLAIEHKLKEIPIVDHEERLLGVVPQDAILAALQAEHVDDLLKFAGIHRFTDPAKSILTASPAVLVKKRLPWLLVGLGGGLAASAVVSTFQGTLREQLILASFIPAIVYIADAVGAQTQTIFIRSLSVNRGLNILGYLARELKVGAALAVILGGAIGAIVGAFWEPPLLGLIVGASFAFGIAAAILAAMFFPWLFLKLKIDPAIASGPFATVIRDLLSLLIYFAIASLVLGAAVP